MADNEAAGNTGKGFSRGAAAWALLALMWMAVPCLQGQDFFQIREEIEQNAWIKPGGLFLRPSLTIGNIGYNTNIYSFDYLKTPDWIANTSLNLDAAVVLRNRFIIRVFERPSYSWRRDSEDERGFNNEFRLEAHTYAGRLNLHYRFEKSYVRSAVNPEIEWRLRRWETSHEMSVDYGNQQRFYISGYVRRVDYRFEDELLFNTYNLQMLFARSEYWAGVSLNKVLFTRTRFSFRGEYFDHQYEFTRLRDRVGGQFSFQLAVPGGRNFVASFQYGLRFVRPIPAIYRDFVKPFGNGVFVLRLSGRLRFNVDYLLDSRYSFAGADLYYDEQSAGAGLRLMLSRNVELNGNLRTGKRSYYSLASDYLRRRDDYNQGTFGLIWRPGHKTEIGIQYVIYDSDSAQLRFLRGYQSMGGYIRYDF